MDPRLNFIDYDARPQPKTDRFCCKCQRDLKVGQTHRYVYVVDGMCAVHPEDIAAREKQADDYGWLLVGLDCAKKIGLEWTLAEPLAPGS
ncbi:hypothetical protein G6L37_06660 [Agrobacterium rubi]|nr:hypothetical protein [Agrobacterium rubi]NTF25045.1 hypothetical protein [Agrobacterium rubi]